MTQIGRLAVIGSGPIVGFHVSAARAVGFTVEHVAARPGSGSAQRFADEHGLRHAIDDPFELLARSNEWDSVLLAAATDHMPDLLKAACQTEKPILAEKPLARHSTLVTQFDDFSDRIMVGYNRRFYSSVEFLRNFVQSGGPTVVQCQLPDVVPAEGSLEERLSLVRLNSVHGFDLLRFLFGDLFLGDFITVGGTTPGASVQFTSARGDIGTIVANWNAPANFSIAVDRGGERVELRPFEIATKFVGMKVEEPTQETPIRRYLPNVVGQSVIPTTELKYKAGFFEQYVAFASLVNGGRDPRSATIHDAREALKIAEAFYAALS
jgi:predicted dehydrogenase